jgi:hypothetical protein
LVAEKGFEVFKTGSEPRVAFGAGIGGSHREAVWGGEPGRQRVFFGVNAVIRHVLVGVGLRHPAAQFIWGELALEDVTLGLIRAGVDGHAEEGQVTEKGLDPLERLGTGLIGEARSRTEFEPRRGGSVAVTE